MVAIYVKNRDFPSKITTKGMKIEIFEIYWTSAYIWIFRNLISIFSIPSVHSNYNPRMEESYAERGWH